MLHNVSKMRMGDQSLHKILASISSRVRPFVSGTTKIMKRREAKAITPKPAKRTPVPTSACNNKVLKGQKRREKKNALAQL